MSAVIAPFPVSRSGFSPGRGWHARADWLIGWALADWAVIFACWALMVAFDNVIVLVLGIVVVASRLHALGVVLHDACHRPSRRKTPSWWIVEALAGWPIGSTTEAMRYHHLRHHRLSGTPEDPYLHPLQDRGAWMRALLTARGALLPALWTSRAFVAPFALTVPAVRTFYGRTFLQDRSRKSLREHPEVVACARADLAQAGAHLLAMALIIGYELPFISFYLMPWMLAGMLNARRVIVEHSTGNAGLSQESVLETTNTHDAGVILNALLYPHNIGLHQAHHRFPTVSFPRLRFLHQRLLQGSTQ